MLRQKQENKKGQPNSLLPKSNQSKGTQDILCPENTFPRKLGY